MNSSRRLSSTRDAAVVFNQASMSSKRGSSSVSPARRAAFDILRRVEQEGAYASTLIAALHESNLSREDRALAQEIALGVLRWQRALDYFIELYSNRSIERIDLSVLIALRMGLYQLRHLTRIPQSAAVNESVNLVKRVRVASAARMVNAVLRNAARNLSDKAGEREADPIEKLSIGTSHPRWLIERWIEWLGPEETREIALANNSPPSVAFRVNTLRADVGEAIKQLQSQGASVRASELVPGAVAVESGAWVIADAAERGLVYIQDEASQLVSLLLDARSGERVLDMCAAPGSKSSHIAALTRGEAWVVACDIHPHRLATLAATCRRLGIESVDAVAMDATREWPMVKEALRFDRVLIDAPCTGTGTLRRNPEIKWRLAPDDPARLAEVQLSLLTRATDAVRSGGRLVYSTCSLEREENERVITRFIESGAPFRVIEPDAHPDLITGDGFVRTFPHRHAMDGFFAAVLERL
ncbi:MAG TPA: 16S rRNA (cytosine(967)-C(5))-methyltransferase RsmB [Blastocatellia bacterium]|nr:16S rRNA (cytosine(967)-C(5))-methyltransferase RsmB [Blastocatellia bacterium]